MCAFLLLFFCYQNLYIPTTPYTHFNSLQVSVSYTRFLNIYIYIYIRSFFISIFCLYAIHYIYDSHYDSLIYNRCYSRRYENHDIRLCK